MRPGTSREGDSVGMRFGGGTTFSQSTALDGKCTLSVAVGEETPWITVHSFTGAARIKPAKTPGSLGLDPARLALAGITRDFAIVLETFDAPNTEVQVRLQVRTPRGGSSRVETDDAGFWIDAFDFPMIDHTRLSRDQRCAVVFKNPRKTSARIAVAYVPRSSASLKEKPYIQEMIQELLGAKQATGAEKR
jgi:hypothetical protein